MELKKDEINDISLKYSNDLKYYDKLYLNMRINMFNDLNAKINLLIQDYKDSIKNINQKVSSLNVVKNSCAILIIFSKFFS